MPTNTKSIYQTKYEKDKKKLKEIEKKLKYLEKISPEEQNKLYFKQAISEEIWRKKYKAKSDKSIVDTWKRIARFLSQNEEKKDIWYLYFFDLLEGFKFLPGGRITYGTDPDKSNITLFNCFIGGRIEDSMAGIMKELVDAVMTLKSGGGYGNNFSTLRPKGALIKSTGGKSSGVLSFMHIWDEAAKQIRMGNCFAKGTKIYAKDGLVNIEDLKIGDEVVTYDGFKPITAVFNNGKQDVFRVSTHEGYTVDITLNHKLWFWNKEKNWFDLKPLSEFKPGDKIYTLAVYNENGKEMSLKAPEDISINNTFNMKKYPKTLTSGLAYWLGFLYGNGSIHPSPKAKITWSTTDNEYGRNILKKINNILEEEFGESPLPTSCYGKCIAAYFNRVQVYNFLKINNFLKSSTRDLNFPKVLFKAKPEIRASFIAGYFDADGSYQHRGGFSLTSIDKEFLHNIQLLLLTLGIVSRIELLRKAKGKWNPLYRLLINKYPFEDKFREIIGQYSEKIKITKFKTKKRKQGMRLDIQVKDLFKLLPDIKHGIIYKRVPGKNEYVQYGTLMTIRDDLKVLGYDTTPLDTILSFVPLKITNIEPVGKLETFDIEVADVHTLLAEGIYTSNSRRSAMLSFLNIDHPDIVDYINAKDKVGFDVPLGFFNMSVAMSDDFMNAVLEDKDWELKFDGKVYKVVKARELFDKIVEHAYNTGEPGIGFLDTVNKLHTLYYLPDQKVYSSNACLTDDIFITTTNGVYQVKDLIGKEFKIFKDQKIYETESKGFFYTGKKPVFKLVTKEGYEIKATGDHLFKVIDRDGSIVWKELKDLKQGDKLPLPDYTGFDWNGKGTEAAGYLLGVLIGDGHITRDKNTKKDRAFISVWNPKNKPTMVKKIEKYMKDLSNNSIQFKGWQKYIEKKDLVRISHIGLLSLAHEYGLDYNNKKLTDEIEKTSKAFYIGLIRGIFDTDGTIYKTSNWSIRLSQSNLDLLKRIQRMLLRLGIKSTIYQNRRPAGWHELPDGHGGYKKYYTKTNHELHIGSQSIKKFYEIIGFYNDLKQVRLVDAINNTKFNRQRNYMRVEYIEYIDDVDVYDVTIKEIHEFEGNGFQVHNCNEVYLPPHGSCNLGSFNLTQFVNNPFESNSEFNYDKFAYYIPIAVRFLDNVIDLTDYPLPEQRQQEVEYRHIGLGITGLGNTLIFLGKHYGEGSGKEWAKNLMKFYTNTAYKSSSQLAIEKGIFKDFNKDKYIDGLFISRLDKDTIESIKSNGLRNASLISNPPVGTGSILANNVSSGIEPIFANEYSRKMRRDDGSPEEQVVMDYAYKLWKDNFGDKPLPDYWVKAYDLTPNQHIDMLIDIQYYVDKSTSKTINVPTDYPIEKVKELYFKAWRSGLKGFTIFRPTSNTELVLETKDDNKDNNKNNTDKTSNNEVENKPKDNNQESKPKPNKKKKREFMLSGKTYKLKSPKEKYSYYVTINNFIDDNGNVRPFEIFINTKDPRQPIFAFISRLLSALFRRESNLDFIIREMQATLVHGEGFFDPKDGKHVPSLIAYIGKVIKQHIESLKFESLNSQSNIEDKKEIETNKTIKNNIDIFTPVISINNDNKDGSNNKDSNNKDSNKDDSPFEICPECGMKGLKVENGCKTCIYCGYSGCE